MTNPNPAAPRDDIMQAATGGPDFTPKEWPNPAAPLTAEALIGYLWTATGRDRETRVCDLFDDDDPLVRDVEAVLAARATSTPAGLDVECAVCAHPLTEHRTPGSECIHARCSCDLAEDIVRAALQGADR